MTCWLIVHLPLYILIIFSSLISFLVTSQSSLLSFVFVLFVGLVDILLLG